MRNKRTNATIKAALGANQSSLNKCEKFNNFPVSNINQKRLINQRICLCGVAISQGRVVLNNAMFCLDCEQKESILKKTILEILITPRKTLKCVQCKGCKKPYALAKLSSLLVCKNCLASAQKESASKRNRIIAGIIENYSTALRRQIFGGELQ